MYTFLQFVVDVIFFSLDREAQIKKQVWVSMKLQLNYFYTRQALITSCLPGMEMAH